MVVCFNRLSLDSSMQASSWLAASSLTASTREPLARWRARLIFVRWSSTGESPLTWLPRKPRRMDSQCLIHHGKNWNIGTFPSRCPMLIRLFAQADCGKCRLARARHHCQHGTSHEHDPPFIVHHRSAHHNCWMVHFKHPLDRPGDCRRGWPSATWSRSCLVGSLLLCHHGSSSVLSHFLFNGYYGLGSIQRTLSQRV